MRYNGSKTITGNVECPFFASVTEKSISCEGIGEADRNVMWFKAEKQMKSHVNEFCNHYPNGCPIAAAADQKYERK